MNATQIIFSSILFILSVVSFFIASLQFKEKGYLFNNAYIHASKEERNRMDKKPYYRQSAVIFATMGIVVLMTVFSIITSLNWLFVVTIALSVLMITYAIISSIIIERKRK